MTYFLDFFAAVFIARDINPKDLIMPIKMVLEYFHIKNYKKFLSLTNRMRKENQYDILVRLNLVKYYIEVESNTEMALKIINELDLIIIDNPNLLHFYMQVELYKAKIYLMIDQIDYAKIYGERVWFEHQNQNEELFSLLFEVYKNLGDWEVLEDFCMEAYTDNRFSPEIFIKTYFVHLKRQYFKKAEHIYEYVNQYYPEYTTELENIKKEFL